MKAKQFEKEVLSYLSKMDKKRWKELQDEKKSLRGNKVFILVRKFKGVGFGPDSLTAKDKNAAVRIAEIMKEEIEGGAITPKNYENIALYTTPHENELSDAYYKAKEAIDEKTGKLPKDYKLIYTF